MSSSWERGTDYREPLGGVSLGVGGSEEEG